MSSGTRGGCVRLAAGRCCRLGRACPEVPRNHQWLPGHNTRQGHMAGGFPASKMAPRAVFVTLTAAPADILASYRGWMEAAAVTSPGTRRAVLSIAVLVLAADQASKSLVVAIAPGGGEVAWSRSGWCATPGPVSRSVRVIRCWSRWWPPRCSPSPPRCWRVPAAVPWRCSSPPSSAARQATWPTGCCGRRVSAAAGWWTGFT
jgi:hypothetical protein